MSDYSSPAHPSTPGDDGERFSSKPGFFATAPVPVWLLAHPDVDGEAVRVAGVILAHRDPTTDTLPYAGRERVAAVCGISVRTLARKINTLQAVGFLTPIPTYLDAETGQRTYDRVSADGRNNARTSSDWLISDAPPAGDAHPYPIQASEFERPDRIGERIRKRGRFADLLAEGTGQHGLTPPRATSDLGVPPAEMPENPWSDPHATGDTPPVSPVAYKQEPNEEGPTNARAREAAGGGGESWLVGDPSGEQPPTDGGGGLLDTPGARLLAGLRAADGSRVAAHGIRKHAPAIDAALTVLGADEITDHLTGGGIRTAGGIVTRIGSLPERVEQAKNEARKRAAVAAVRACRYCDGDGMRFVDPNAPGRGTTPERCDHQPPATDEHDDGGGEVDGRRADGEPQASDPPDDRRTLSGPAGVPDDVARLLPPHLRPTRLRAS